MPFIRDWIAAGMQALQGILHTASVEPTSGSLALAVALVTVLPMAGFVPMTLVCLAVAAKLPAVPAVAVILTGVAANTTIAWVLARTVFGARIEDWLQRRGGWLGAVRAGAHAQPLKWAFLARYVPAPFIAAPMVLSSTGVGLGTTLMGSLIAMLPWTAVYVYVSRAGREDTLPGISRAVGALALAYLLLMALRSRLLARAVPAPERPLMPRREGLPVVRLFTIPDQDLSEEARRELAALRDALGFEVEEIPLAGGDGEEARRYGDHAPVAILGGERLFNYKMDEHVLRERLLRHRQAGGME